MGKKNKYNLPKLNKAKLKKLSKYGLLSTIGLTVIFLLSFGSYSIAYSNRVFAHQYIGNDNFSRKTKIGLKEIIIKKSADFAASEIKLVYESESGNKDFILKPNEVGINYDIDKTVDEIWNVGRNESIPRSFFDQLKSIFIKNHHQAVVAYNEEVLNAKIAEIGNSVDIPEKDFSLEFKSGKFSLTANRADGKRISQKEIISELKKRFSQYQTGEIRFKSEVFKPQVNEEKALSRLNEANKIVGKGELVLTYEGQQLKIDTDTIGGMIKSKTRENNLELVFDDNRMNTYLDSIAQLIDVEPVNARLQIVNGKAVAFDIARIGKTLSKEESKERIKQGLISRIGDSEKPSVELVIITKQPEITESSINSLGIGELVGSGSTQFKGSPANRIHNIQTGAAALNGVLIKPDEIFSTAERLGEVNGTTGYLPELVIKDNQTVPEYGGGLCQVSTTLFRAALYSGMEIIDRSNHRYRVSYYEPPVGMDATIYDPSPDFKFKNNYPTYVLVQATVSGYTLKFDFYGTKDGRVIEIGTPTTWDPVDPGPRINVETDTLQPGEEKKIESAHQGISAKFHYKVSRSGQVLQEKDFISKYIPWPEKWLVGKQPTPAPVPVPDPNVTPAPAPTPDPAVTPAT